MVYIYGFIDIIIKRSALDRNPTKNSQYLIEKENLSEDHFDKDLVCVPGGMNSTDAESAVRFYEREYGIKIFDLTDPKKPAAKDGIIINGPFGPTTKCDWIQSFGWGWVYARPLINNEISWDADNWLESFRKASQESDWSGIHGAREMVYRNTQEIVTNGGYVLNGNTIHIPEPSDSVAFSRPITGLIPGRTDKMEIKVLKEDCLKTARDLQRKNPLVLNMANRRTPGGGVEYGAGAQEECLFRSSNYYRTLYPLEHSAYPMDRNYGGIYSPNVTIFRGLESDGYTLLDKPFLTNFVAVAALNRPTLSPNGTYTDSERTGMENKIRTMLNIAVKYRYKVLILSAFGCGAFRNPPKQVAGLFKKILDEPLYRTNFEEVYFSIKADHNDQGNNYACFKDVLEKQDS